MEMFVNELVSMQQYFASGHEQREKAVIKVLIERQQEDTDVEEATRNSITVRETGNIIMRRNNGDIRYAARLYTKAMFTATKGSKELAFAHANRALALTHLGYLEAAYDDCVCALEEGYPNDMRYKIIIRQAELAKELGQLENMKQHISVLETMKLGNLANEKLTKLKNSISESASNDVNMEYEDVVEQSFEEPFKIVNTAGQKQRSMIATKDINKGDTVCLDRAFAFMAKRPGSQICSNCADTMIVPFPCSACRGSIVYCSLKCRKNHARLHAYECFLIVKFLNGDLTTLLASRMLLEGLPEILPYLKKAKDAQSLWRECFENKNMMNLNYIKVLQSTSCWSITENTGFDFNGCIVSSENAVIFLKHSKFFECLTDTAASIMDWKIFLAAILLRHMGQVDICPNEQYSFFLNLNQLSPRVERGRLFALRDDNYSISFFFPKLFNCNHDCTPALEKKLNGRNVRALATRDIKPGEEITDSYIGIPFCPLMTTLQRQSFLFKHFYFKCECVECQAHNNYDEFNQFWCENDECKKSYSAEQCNGRLKCTHCGKVQKLNFDEEINVIKLAGNTAQGREAIFKRFDNVTNKNFKDYNLMKYLLIVGMMQEILRFNFEYEPLRISELDKMLEYTISLLKYPFDKMDRIGKLTYLSILWDIVALRRKKIAINDFDNLLQLLNELDIKERSVFMNYYEEFILPLI